MKIELFLTRRGRRTLLAKLTAVSLMPSLVLLSPAILDAADEVTPVQSHKAAPKNSVVTPTHVNVNRTLPSFTPLNSKFELPSNPTDQDIFSHSPFEDPLIPIGGKTSPLEDAALGQALTAFSKRTVRDDFSAPESFLASHPQSAWRISLLTNLGWAYRQTGWYSKAMSAWEQAWTLGRSIAAPSANAKATIDRALAELIVMNARVGRMDTLASLIKVADRQELLASSKEKLESAKQALVLMQKKPETSFRCGPMAVEKIRNVLDHNKRSKLKIMSMGSTQQGTNMAQLKKLAAKMGMDDQVAKRAPGSEIIAPAVVNWKVGHFAALIDRKGSLWRLHDPTFGNDVWISQTALDAEASGYFLVKNGSLPVGWTAVGDKEAASIWGKGTNNGGNNNFNGGPTPKCGCPTAPGAPPAGPGSPQSSGNAPGANSSSSSHNMAVPSIYEMLASLCVEDTPLFYTPPYGPAVEFTVTYSQREVNQPSTFTYSNVGPLWTFSWLSYITDDPTNPGADITQYLSGGGTLTYTGYDSSTHEYAPQEQTGCVVKLLSSSSYELDEPDGSKQIFAVATHGSSRKVFMTQTIDPQGNGLTFTYDGFYRLVAVTDALGQVTTLTYGTPFDMYKISQIIDPFGRSINLSYTTTGNLQSSTDMIGIVSTYVYTKGALSSLITPYGTTTFDVGQDTDKRWVQINDPQGGQQRLETWNNYNTNVPSSAPSCPAGFDNEYLDLRNSFYWDKKAMMDAPGNYNMAYITHWLHEPDYSTMSAQVESVKAPLESRVYYGYPDQPANIVTGSSGQASAIARIMDDGSTQESQASYNEVNEITESIDPLGRTTDYTYAANNVDVIQATQKNGSNHDVLYSVTYNNLHEPLTVTDVSGQVTTYTYNAQGQPLTVKNAKNESTTFTYTSGYLTSITGSQTGATVSLAYDSMGRISTITDLNGYVIAYSYDNLNRVVQVTYPDGTCDQAIYTKLDITKTKDRQNRLTQYVYNSLEQLVGTVDPAGRTINYDRCLCGELKGIVDSLGHRTSWAQDVEGRTISKTFADNSQVSYTYDGVGRLATITDAKGQIATYTYNEDNSLDQIAYTNAAVSTPTVSFTYDPVYLRPSSMTDGTGTTQYVYNPVNGTIGSSRLASETGPLGSTAQITFGYDELGRNTNIAINGTGSSVSYDSLGRCVTETNPLATFSYGYDGSTPRLQTISNNQNGLNSSFGYQTGSTQDFRLTDITNHSSGTTVLSKFDYTYNAVGDILTEQEQADSSPATLWSYGYDNADQLLSAVWTNSTGGELSRYVYGYDLAGNRISHQVGLSVGQTSYNNLNQITGGSAGGPLNFSGTLNKPGTVTVGGNTATMDGSYENFSGTANVTTGTNAVAVVATSVNGYAATNNYQVVVPSGSAITPTYDADGNMTNNGQGQTYTWDARNELTSITYASGASTQFTYDAPGRRIAIIEKDAGGTVTSTKQFVWIGSRMAEERDASNNVIKRFYAQGEQIGSNNYYYTFDHLGSVREMTNSSGTIVARYDYDPYGRVTTITGTVPSDFQYAGYYAHQPSGLYLTLFRAYDPNTARWLARDPLGESQGTNIYTYVLNDPINLCDPLGLKVAIDESSVGDGYGHASIRITPDNPSDFPNVPMVTAPDGSKFFTLGGHPNGWLPLGIGAKLHLDTNNKEDTDCSKNKELGVIPTPAGMTDSQFIQKLLDNAANYKNNLPYDATPQSTGGAYNSNSMASGLTQSAGGDTSGIDSTTLPGFDKPVPGSNFSK